MLRFVGVAEGDGRAAPYGWHGLHCGSFKEPLVDDPLGVDTYSSCKRAKDQFGAESLIIATQEFHVPRAVWVCDRIGLEAQGAYPPARATKSTVIGNVREVAAVAKAMLDVARGREPAG